jgi:SAM-dependent methyltransferase
LATVTHPLLTRRQSRILDARRDRLRAQATGRVLELEAGVGAAEVPDHSFDTIVMALVLCSAFDPGASAAALHRWLAPDGRLLFLEHVAGVGFRAELQRAASPSWSALARGCHLDRDTVNTLRRAGFAVTDCERFRLPGPNPLLTTWAQGVARPRPILREIPLEGTREEEEVHR